MKALTVSLDYGSTEYSPSGARHQTPLALPLRVLDADGSLVAEGAASTTIPAYFDISRIDGPAYVRLTWPSGRTETQRVDVEEGATAQVSFNDRSISRNEWSAWAVPRLGERTVLATPEVEPGLRIDRFDRAWLRMWTFEPTGWMPAPVEPIASDRNAATRQLDFQLDDRCRLLQVGGAHVPWRFVALPGGGACRVLLTPNESGDPRAEPLKVLVTTFRRDAETLLEFLARDSLRAANTLATYQPLAQQLMSEKVEDPVSAIAGAYFLLRTEGWRRIPRFWFDNLYVMFPWLADPAVIRCALMIRQGLALEADEDLAVRLLQDCLDRGMPVFSEGMALLQESASVLRSAHGTSRQGLFDQVERLVASQAWAGAVFSFYGETPDQPSPERMVGPPGKPRPASRSKAAMARSIPTATPDTLMGGYTFLRDLS